MDCTSALQQRTSGVLSNVQHPSSCICCDLVVDDDIWRHKKMGSLLSPTPLFEQGVPQNLSPDLWNKIKLSPIKTKGPNLNRDKGVGFNVISYTVQFKISSEWKLEFKLIPKPLLSTFACHSFPFWSLCTYMYIMSLAFKISQDTDALSLRNLNVGFERQSKKYTVYKVEHNYVKERHILM